MRRLLTLLAIESCVCSWQDPACAAADTATVRLAVTTTFGQPVGKVAAVLRAVGTGTEYRQAGQAIAFRHVPFGLYDLRVSSPNFATREDRVGVYQGEVRLWIGLYVSPLHSGEPSEVIGTIAAQGHSLGELWIRAVPFYSSDFIEDQASASGDFRLADMHPGRYVIVVLDHETLLMTKAIDYHGGRLRLALSVPQH